MLIQQGQEGKVKQSDEECQEGGRNEGNVSLERGTNDAKRGRKYSTRFTEKKFGRKTKDSGEKECLWKKEKQHFVAERKT